MPDSDPQYEHDVFLSYSRADTMLMQRVKAKLEAAGLRVWIDQTGIPPGTPNWRRAIQQAIRESCCFLVIFSPTANESQWVAEEMDYAALQHKPFFSALGHGEEDDAIPFGYARHQWADLRDEDDFDTEIGKLIAALQTQAAAPPSAPPPPTSLIAYGWQPSAWVKVLAWLFFHPMKIPGPQTLQTDRTLRHATAWLSSTLTWLPVLLLALHGLFNAAALDLLATVNVLLGLLFVAVGWPFTVLFDMTSPRKDVGSKAGLALFIIGAGVLGLLVGLLLVFRGLDVVWGHVWLGLAAGVTMSLGTGVALWGLGYMAVLLNWLAVASYVYTVSPDFTLNIAWVFPTLLAGWGLGSGVVWFVLSQNRASTQARRLGQGYLLLAAAGYLFLIWYSFFGGYAAFAG